jgi:hypothetical protein
MLKGFRFGALAPLVLVAASALATPFPTNTDLTPGVINAAASPYGAVSTSLTTTCASGTSNDSTPKIQGAIDDASANGGGIVFLPTGIYCLAGHLTIPSHVTLKGVLSGTPVTYTNIANQGTVLLAFDTTAPFITLAPPGPPNGSAAAVLDGVTIYYPGQTLPTGSSWTPKVYPYTVEAYGDTAIENVMLLNSYQGINLTTGSGRHVVNNVFGQPIANGIRVQQSLDVGRISNVHFWIFWSAQSAATPRAAVENWIRRNGTAFIFADAEWEVVHDVFAWGYLVGMNFGPVGAAATSGEMSNVQFDDTGVGIDSYGTSIAGVNFTNLRISSSIDTLTPRVAVWNHSNSNFSNFNIVNGIFFGLTQQAIIWEQPGLLMLSNSRIESVTSGTPAIKISAGDAMIQNNAFTGAVAGTLDVSVTSTGRVLITGNSLYGGTLPTSPPAGTHLANNW